MRKRTAASTLESQASLSARRNTSRPATHVRIGQPRSVAPSQGPTRAFLVQGDDELGAVAAIHKKILDAEVNVFASWGVSDGRGGFGYVMYVRPERYEEAARALDV